MKEEHLSSSAPSKEPLKEVLRRNFDMIVAGLGVALLGLHLAGVLLGAPEDVERQNADLDATLQDVSAHLGDTRFGTDEYAVRMAGAIAEVRGTWGPIPGDAVVGEEGVAWSSTLVAQSRAGESNSMEFRRPEDVRGEARFGANRVEWNTHEDNNVTIGGFKVLRRAGESGSPTPVGEVKGDAFQFDDRNVQPGRKYTYWVVAVPGDPAVADQVPESPRSLPVTLEAVADFKLTLVGADRTKKTATLKVEKWHNENWFSKQFVVAVGQRVGSRDAGSGVDYGTGRRVKSLDFEDAFDERKREEVVFDGAARVLMKDGAPVTETVTARDPVLKIKVEVEGGGLPAKTLTHEKRS